MTHGIDTDFLVAVEIADHPFHEPADRLLTALLDAGHDLAVTPHTLAEFIHVVSDPRRMPRPLTMREAAARAEAWWQAREVVRVFPDGESVLRFFAWMQDHGLGRKRLLDTMLAAVLERHGVRSLVTNNGRDFEVFRCFDLVPFRE